MREKTNLQERIAALRASKQAGNSKELKTRVASAWTLAKSLLPTAPSDVQMKMASSLLVNSTQALKASLRQTAINAHYTKLAEKFEQIHKVELNEFLEDESLLNKLKGELERELKGEAKNASAKTADEIPPMDAPAEDVPPVDNNMDAPAGDVPPVEGAPVDDMPPAEDVPPVDETAIPDAKKEELLEKIDNLEADVNALEESIESEEEIDFAKVFDNDTMSDKVDSLANEGDDLGAEFGEEDMADMGGEEGEEEDLLIEADGGASFFSDTEALEGQLDGDDDVTDPSSFFTTASRHDISAMDTLLASPKKAAKEEVVERGEMTQELLDEAGVADAEADHEDVILFEVLKTIKPEKYDPGTKRDTEPKLQKSANTRSSSTIRSLGNVRTASSKDQQKLASLVFPDDM